LKVNSLQAQSAVLLGRITELKKTEVKPATEQEEITIAVAHKAWQNHLNSRRRIMKELWYTSLELLPEGNKEELWVRDVCLGPGTKVTVEGTTWL